jgi:hypothetical protein
MTPGCAGEIQYRSARRSPQRGRPLGPPRISSTVFFCQKTKKNQNAKKQRKAKKAKKPKKPIDKKHKKAKTLPHCSLLHAQSFLLIYHYTADAAATHASKVSVRDTYTYEPVILCPLYLCACVWPRTKRFLSGTSRGGHGVWGLGFFHLPHSSVRMCAGLPSMFRTAGNVVCTV